MRVRESHLGEPAGQSSISTFYFILALVVLVGLVGLLLGHKVLLRNYRAFARKKPAGAPVVTFAPTSKDFGLQAIGSSSLARTFTLTNTGTAPLKIGSFAIVGGDQASFSLVQNCPSTLPVGETCALHVIFTPSLLGPHESSIAVSDDATPSPQVIALNGVGTPLNPSEGNFDFGDQPVGSAGALKTVTITNRGVAVVHLGKVVMDGANAKAFSMSSTCQGSLAAAAHCRAIVTFKPLMKGSQTATLKFVDERGVNFLDVLFTGTGTGPGQFMALSPDKTHLINTFTNKPVFITGDAAWSLIAQLSDQDVETYLADRARRGFNAIIVNLPEHMYANHAPANFFGDAPFTGNTFSTPNEPYFAHADHVISRAAAHGITVFLFPAYLGHGSHDCNAQNEGWGTDMERASDPVMHAWGVYVGNRYKSFPNIVYVIGCDADPRTCSPPLVGKLNAVAAGIKSVDSVHLMTADNASLQSSLDVFSGYPWLNISYLYGASDVAKLNAEYSRPDFLPFLQGEDEYEGEHSSTSITPLLLRTRQYWSVLSGAYLGSFFGNNPIWCFSETNPASAVPCRKDTTWKAQLDSPGSVGQSIFGKLFRSREHWLLAPDIHHTVVTAGYGSGATLTTTARTRDGQTIISDIPNGSSTTLKVDMSKIKSSGNTAKCWWFNPRDGSAKLIGTFPNSGSRDFTAPDANDWLLVIDDARAKLPPPGSADL
jgi:hypothetical protein